MELASADETEPFWQGMLLGLYSTTHRNLSKKTDLRSKGTSAAVLLRARGDAIRWQNESCLKRNKAWLDNGFGDKESRDAQNIVRTFCVSTWSYGD